MEVKTTKRCKTYTQKWATKIHFYRQNKAYFINSNAQNLSSDGGILIAEQIERKHGLIKNISDVFIDKRNRSYVKYDYSEILKLRVFGVLLGYWGW